MMVPIRRAERRVAALSAALYASYNTERLDASLSPLFFSFAFGAQKQHRCLTNGSGPVTPTRLT